jgi:hypothetical protein
MPQHQINLTSILIHCRHINIKINQQTVLALSTYAPDLSYERAMNESRRIINRLIAKNLVSNHGRWYSHSLPCSYRWSRAYAMALKTRLRLVARVK